MTLTINSLIESVSNPTGHFMTLERIFPRRDPLERPIFNVRSHTVDFQVEWAGARYILKCFKDSELTARERARAFCEATGSLESPLLAKCKYLTGEMAVVDSSGTSTLQDVVLQRLPEGRTLHRFLLESCDNNDTCSLLSLSEGVAELGQWMQRHGIAHRNLKPSVIRVDHSCLPVPLHYDFALADADPQTLSMDEKPLLRLALAIRLLAAAPELYRALGQERIFSPAGMSAIFRTLCETNGLPESLVDAATALFSGEIHGREALLRFVREEFSLPEDFTRRTASRYSSPAADVRYPTYGDEWPVPVVKDVNNNGLYIDVHTEALEGESENLRIVVERDGMYGLVDRRGNFIIPPIYDEVEWDGENNLAAVSQDGQWGLCGRTGEQLTGIQYDWLGSVREGLLLARLDEKFGFLTPGGEVAIEFVYDSASSFGNGIAPVSVAGEDFFIDIRGKRTGR